MLSHGKMHVNKNNICGQRFAEESLPAALPNAIAGHLGIHKLILLANTLFLSTLSGSMAGLLGALIFLEIAIPPDRQSQFSCICMAIVVLFLLGGILAKGIRFGMSITALITLLSIIIAVFLTNVEGVNDFLFAATLLYIAFGTGLAILGFFSGCFSFGLIYAIFDADKNKLNLLCGIFLVVIATLIANKLSFSSYLSSNYLERNYNLQVFQSSSPLFNIYLSLFSIKCIAVVCGNLFGVGIATASCLATQFEHKGRNNLDFLRTWAIAVGSWGGTSFYNLDLSGVDFTGSKLANTDLRAQKFYRTCLKGVTGLERARVDNRYLDLTNPKVQKLLTNRDNTDRDFSRINLQGAYLQGAKMMEFNLIETNLNGADLQNADLSESILVRTQVTGVDFTEATLTGICIEDWTLNSQTCFAGVKCDYIYRKLDKNGNPTNQYPIGRNFEPGEFEALFQEVGNVVELVFKEGVNWPALSFTFRKFQLEDEGLGLELKGVEQRGGIWVVKVAHNENVPQQVLEQRFNQTYSYMQNQLAANQQIITHLLGTVSNQAEALKGLSKPPFGNSFFITGSTITNLAGSGQIDYDEAASKIRNIVANGGDSTQVTTIAQNLLSQLQRQGVPPTLDKQVELIEQVILSEANKNIFFKECLVQQGQQIAEAMPETAIASALRNAIAQLT